MWKRLSSSEKMIKNAVPALRMQNKPILSRRNGTKASQVEGE
jgi:hypothetical protein